MNSKKLKNLNGIEHFVNLIRLDCEKNQLTQLDVTKCTQLTELICEKNQESKELKELLLKDGSIYKSKIYSKRKNTYYRNERYC